MNQINKISSLSGLAILNYTAGNSPLCVGELATFKPFAGFEGESLRGIGIPVSNEKLDSVERRQNNKLVRGLSGKNGNELSMFSKQQFHQSVVSLIKNVNENTFMTKLTPDVVLFIIGKKSVWSNKGVVLPKLTLEETVICTLAEFALDKFHTLNGIELKCSFYEGGEVQWKSKH